MTKSEYMKKLSYSLRRLPKEDFNQAIDYFEEYFAEAGEENEQQAIEDLGSPEDAAKELIMNLAEKNMEQPPNERPFLIFPIMRLSSSFRSVIIHDPLQLFQQPLYQQPCPVKACLV